MSKVDTTFDFANSLVMEWGQPAQLITKGDPFYDINTGETTEDEIIYNVKIVITALDISETGGLYQANDVKIVIDPVQINYIYLTEADYFLVPRDGAPDQYLKIIEPKTFRGDKPVGYVIVARPQ
jgi:hypothetical protein